MKEIASLSKKELRTLLKHLTTYQKLQKAIGKRGVSEYHRVQNGKDILKVEYFPTKDMSGIQKQTLEIYEKVYSKKIDTKDILWIEKQDLQWWIRVFLNDEMIDMSFARFAQILQ